MVKSHVIKLNPTKGQIAFLKRSCGTARFVYNLALEIWSRDYKETGFKWTAFTFIKHLNSIKGAEFPWMLEVGKSCGQYAVHDLDAAFKNMFKLGFKYPKFKKKNTKDSFVAVENKQAFGQKDFKIKIPRLGWVKCCENLRFEGKINYVRIKRIADMWFAVINIDTEIPAKTPIIRENQTVVGVDVGISNMMVLSDGTIYENPRALKSNLKSLKRLQRGYSRKVNGSNSKKRQLNRLTKKHYKISCIRKNAIHQATSEILKKYDKVVIESLKPLSMIKNRRLSMAIHDIGFGEMKRQFVYKGSWLGKDVVLADTFYPSSKLCSCCGNKKDVLSLADRIYKCDLCGFVCDRDLNAAKNLAKYSPTSKSEGSQACGEDSSFLATKSRSSKKHEIVLVTNSNKKI